MGLNLFRSIKGTIILQRNRLELSTLLRSPTLAIACGLGAGLVPVLPGTVGTLVALPIWWALLDLDSVLYLAVVACAFIFGIRVCAGAAATLGQHDPSAIVFDEVVGYLLALLVVPVTLGAVILSFFIFRILDVLKPWPIGWVDRHVRGGLGIMLDDLLAGAFTALIVLAVRGVGLL